MEACDFCENPHTASVSKTKYVTRPDGRKKLEIVSTIRVCKDHRNELNISPVVSAQSSEIPTA